MGSLLRVVTVGDESKPAMVLLHGLGPNGLKDWEQIIEALKTDYYILALDFPGFGQSSLAEGRLSPENFAAITHWLINAEGLHDVHLAGHSMGAAVALFYAGRYPEDLVRLTLIDAAGVLHRAAFVKAMAEFDQRNYDFLPEFLRRPAAKLASFGNQVMENINLWPDLTQPLQASDLAWAFLLNDEPNTNAALSLINTDYSTIIDQVSTPTVIIWGERDSVAPLRTGYLLRGLIEDSELHVLRDAEHVPIKTHVSRVAHLMRVPPSGTGRALAPPNNANPLELNCHNRTGQRFSGHYSRVVLDNCLDVRLVDLRAESILMRDSEAELVGVQVSGGRTALRMERSAAKLTDVRLSGDVAIELSASRLDMAGTLLEASETAVQIRELSVLISSVSEVKSPLYRGNLHGAVRAENVRGEALSRLRSQARPLP